MKSKWLAMQLHKTAHINIAGQGPFELNEQSWPDGCEGIMFVFRTKKAAKAWEGKDVELMEVGFGE
jgi:hypothetical protein